MIFSGTGSDGSRGIQAIKEVGGLAIVQAPETSKFDGMPCSAVNSGFADIVVDAEKIPSKLISYMTHPLISVKTDASEGKMIESEQAFQEVLRLLTIL